MKVCGKCKIEYEDFYIACPACDLNKGNKKNEQPPDTDSNKPMTYLKNNIFVAVSATIVWIILISLAGEDGELISNHPEIELIVFVFIIFLAFCCANRGISPNSNFKIINIFSLSLLSTICWIISVFFISFVVGGPPP